MSLINARVYGSPLDGVSHQLIGPKHRIIATGLIPASVFPEERWHEVELPSGLTYHLERLSEDDSVWDVWVTLPPDQWPAEMMTEGEQRVVEEMRVRVSRDVFGRR